MLKQLLGLILIAVLALLVSCSTQNVSEAVPAVEDNTDVSSAPADTGLEMYYWAGEADQAQ